jgi:hypothetical protein
MDRTSAIDIRCLHCHQWFPLPIFLGDEKTFDTSRLIGNTVQCPHCQRMTGCNKENMRTEPVNESETPRF